MVWKRQVELQCVTNWRFAPESHYTSSRPSRSNLLDVGPWDSDQLAASLEKHILICRPDVDAPAYTPFRVKDGPDDDRDECRKEQQGLSGLASPDRKSDQAEKAKRTAGPRKYASVDLANSARADPNAASVTR
jgi:hypothetical protein